MVNRAARRACKTLVRNDLKTASMSTLTGKSPLMDAVRAKMRRFSRSDLPILIRGETGVGKDLAARTIHRLSSRAMGPYVVVNCAALPPSLVESELFGTVSGAFTGVTGRVGWFQRAHGGTLLLDEIGDMTLDAQRVLLRILEEPEVWPLGSDRAVPIDCRILCATHQHLEAHVARGNFRADLFHRIAVLTLNIPPLRKRVDDIQELVDQFLPPNGVLTSAAMQALNAHGWPGNVRELKNVIHAAVVEADDDAIDAKHLHFNGGAPAISSDSTESTSTLTHAIQEHIRRSLQRHCGNVRATARALRVSPTTIYRYLSLRDT